MSCHNCDFYLLYQQLEERAGYRKRRIRELINHEVKEDAVGMHASKENSDTSSLVVSRYDRRTARPQNTSASPTMTPQNQTAATSSSASPSPITTTSPGTVNKNLNTASIVIGICGGISLVLALIGIYLYFKTMVPDVYSDCDCAKEGKLCQHRKPKPKNSFHLPTIFSGMTKTNHTSPYDPTAHTRTTGSVSSTQPFLYDNLPAYTAQPNNSRNVSFNGSNEPWAGHEGDSSFTLPTQPLIAEQALQSTHGRTWHNDNVSTVGIHPLGHVSSNDTLRIDYEGSEDVTEMPGTRAIWQDREQHRGVSHEMEGEMVAVELDSRPTLLALKRMRKTFERWK